MHKLSMTIFSLVFLLSCTLFGITAAFAADIAVTPGTLEMGFRLANQNSATQAVTISNNGTADLVISAIAVSGGGAGAFGATPGTCPSLTPTILAGGSCTVNVTFFPPSGQDYSASLDIASNSAVTPMVNVALHGGGAYPLSLYINSNTGTGTVAVTAPDPVDAGLSCALDAAYCGAYPGGTSITLTPHPSAVSVFSGWSGCPMTMGVSCFISISGTVNATATFALASLDSLIAAAANGDVIKLPIATYPALTMNSANLITLSGGWNNDLTVQEGFTTINAVTIANGALILDNIQLP